MISTCPSLETPLIRTLPAKGASSAEIFRKADWANNSILLDGSSGGWFDGRYSLIGGAPFGIFSSKGRASRFNYLGTGGTRSPKIFQAKGDPLKALQGWLDTFQVNEPPASSVQGLPFLDGGVVGYFAYELAHQFEAVPPPRQEEPDLPDITLLFLNFFILHDHEQDVIQLIYTPSPEIRMGGDSGALRREGLKKLEALADQLKATSSAQASRFSGEGIHLQAELSPERYRKMVHRAKTYIAAGDLFQANLSYRFSTQCPEASLFPLYQRLQAINPSPFSCYLNLGDIEIASSSPERLVRVKKERTGRIVETRPIAGTKPRGKTPAEDKALRQSLFASPKEQAEHLMMVDLERNDLGKICRYGSVKVDEMMHLEQYSHVFHLVSNIRGEPLSEVGPLQVLRALFPGGTITGVPKIRCMEIISELEERARGIYTGSIGYIGFNGEMDLNIAIRTWVRRGNQMSFQVGAGIVADSDPESEYQETLQKAAALKEALRA